MPEVSIVVPLYNTEAFLPKCIESILSQTYTDFELLLVDDGSTDGSGVLCDRYAEKDTRVRVLHKENGGVQTAVLEGVVSATGQYLVFCDSDDWVADNLIETLYTEMIAWKVDGVRTRLVRCENGRETPEPAFGTRHYAEDEIETQLLAPFFEEQGIVTTAFGNSRCAKMFRRELFLRALSGCDPKGVYGEDMAANLRYLSLCGSVYVTSGYSGYFVRLRVGSATNGYKTGLLAEYKRCINELYALSAEEGRVGAGLSQKKDALYAEVWVRALNSRLPVNVLVAELDAIRECITDPAALREEIGRTRWYVALSMCMAMGWPKSAGILLFRLIGVVAGILN